MVNGKTGATLLKRAHNSTTEWHQYPLGDSVSMALIVRWANAAAAAVARRLPALPPHSPPFALAVLSGSAPIPRADSPASKAEDALTAPLWFAVPKKKVRH